jgi:hypothetical protein
MTTATLNQPMTITQATGVQIAKEICDAVVAKQAADIGLENALLKSNQLWLAPGADSAIAKATINSRTGKAVTTDTIKSWRRVGRVLDKCGDNSGGATASEILTAVNAGFNAPGSFTVNVDTVLDTYFAETEKPSWKGAIKAMGGKIKAETTPKTDSEKFDAELAKQEAQVKKGYKPSAEQVARLIALSK